MHQSTSSSSSGSLAVAILAAGEGKRMKSSTPKVLQPLGGKPMLVRLLPKVLALDPLQVIIVVGHGGEAVKEAIEAEGLSGHVTFVSQEEQLGTGHAVMMTEPALRAAVDSGEVGSLMVLYGDNPLIREATLSDLAGEQQKHHAAATVLTIVPEDRKGYGRIVRSASGSIEKIVEEKDATEDEKAITEVNAGSYCFDAKKLFSALSRISPANQQGEYYLTDVMSQFVAADDLVLPVQADNEWETMGLDSRDKLAAANAILRDQTNDHWMTQGVFILDPATTWIEPEVFIEADATILPGTMLHGRCTIARGATIGPSVVMRDSAVGEGARVQFAVVRNSTIEAEAELGPFCSLREGTVVGRGAKVGTFVETKKTILGPGSKLPHLSYFGDATIGANSNIGAGSITCNYDGKRKHQTVIEDDVFVGSDTMLVAPIKLGSGSATGAGSVVTHDVAPGDLVAGVPAKFRRRREDAADGGCEVSE